MFLVEDFREESFVFPLQPLAKDVAHGDFFLGLLLVLIVSFEFVREKFELLLGLRLFVH